jgi:DnaK suppressor protein
VIQRSADVLKETDYKTARSGASVASALIRTQDGSFGTCVHCDGDISRRRLEAVPWAALCIRCQEAADRDENGAAGPRGIWNIRDSRPA